ISIVFGYVFMMMNIPLAISLIICTAMAFVVVRFAGKPVGQGSSRTRVSREMDDMAAEIAN
ncbi:MAG: hypothetical protein AB1746_17375, partial [Candidatus Zixiibacteriota bacterium]